MTKSSSTRGIFGLIGGILVLVSLAMIWFRFEISIFNFTVSGFGAIPDLDRTVTTLQNAAYLMLFGGILALLFGILMIANVLRSGNLKVGYVFILIGGVLCVVGLLSWLVNASQMDLGFLLGTQNLFSQDALSADIGFFLAIVGPILILIDGIQGIR